MFAVIQTGGKQYRVQEGDILQVEKIEAEAGRKYDFEQVLLIDDGDKAMIGTPFVENALVRAEVVRALKDKKVIVFKKKRRKQYKRMRGHRQELVEVRIEQIIPDLAAAPVREEAKIPVKPAVAHEVEEKLARVVKPKPEKEVVKAPIAKKAAPRVARRKAKKIAVPKKPKAHRGAKARPKAKKSPK
jgi:large subunit ribosomal protein L21